MGDVARVKSHGWRELDSFPLSHEVIARRFTKGPCLVIVSQEPHGKAGTLKWHLYVNIHRNCFHLWEIANDEW